MKKKFYVALIVVCILLPATLSAAIADISIGATALYGGNGGEAWSQVEDGNFEGFADPANYTFGADVRVKLLLAEFGIVGMYGQTTVDDTEYHEISALTTAGVSFDVLGLMRLGLGLGPRYRVLVDKETSNPMILAADGSEVVDFTSFGDTFINSPISYRVTADFTLGSIMLGLNYTVDSQYTLKNYQNVDELFKSDYKSGKVGVSLLFSLL